ncbi:MAG TPA: flagellar basal body protein [Dyella sp.]|uniref:flagellar basal body rod protein FlgB n=1 Tax=Dyella sp. TaxID=1869338 RepID=UPI002C6EC3A8|nr:flagellar basal body protein [Dyella sp.]HUB90317.1 flagellar basal body protein [Dyella sp.]
MDLTTEALRLGISMARMRAEVASANIANVDVAGYRPQRADFAQATGLLREAAEQPTMDAQELQVMTPRMLGESVHVADPGANAPVSLDDEVAELETASVNFQSLTTVMSRRFALMQLALAGRD